MMKSGIVALTFLFASFTSASPALVARTCSPSFTADQSIYALLPMTDVVNEWTPQSNSSGAQIVLETRSARDAFMQGEFSMLTQKNGLYGIIPAFRTQIPVALTAGDNGNLTFGFAGLLSIPTQQFNITCDECSEVRQGNCTIKHPASGQCIIGSNGGDTLSLGSCDKAGVYYFTPAGSA
ncbi:hypothetical protein J132_02327 [Termitomyces sp. J132]|nr:hypothetical protein J132_02327 [Termitomyces sp. J132]